MHSKNRESCISFAIRICAFHCTPIPFNIVLMPSLDSHHAKVKYNFDKFGHRNFVTSQYQWRFLHGAMCIIILNHKIRWHLQVVSIMQGGENTYPHTMVGSVRLLLNRLWNKWVAMELTRT